MAIAVGVFVLSDSASFLFADATTTEEGKPLQRTGKPVESKSERYKLWFPVGECLTYRIRWGPFTVGNTRVNSEWIEKDGKDLLAIRVRTRSTPFFDRIYRVDDFIESIVDPVTFRPLSFTKNLSEGRYRLHEITTFDHKGGMAHWQHLLKDKSLDFAIESDTRDLLSFMYYMRSQKFEPGKTYHFRVMADEKLYDLDVIAKDIEKVSLRNFGKVESLRVEPKAKFQGLFVRAGKLQLWVSNDDRFLCTTATARVPFGTIRAVLMKVEGPGDDFWSHPDD